MKVSSEKVIKGLAIYSVVLFIPIFLLNILDQETSVEQKVVLFMGSGLIVIWCGIGGFLMYRFRNSFRSFFQRIPISWPKKFIIFATLFTLLEEVVTVTLTNTAPLFGVSMEAAHITASSNYFDTIFGHSALLFVGWFFAWAWLLKRYEFKTTHVFLLFGLLGSIAETSFGFGNIFAGFWFFVYGLMIFLPAYSIPQNRGLPEPKFFQYILAIVLPFVFMIPFGILMQAYIHFFDPVFFANI